MSAELTPASPERLEIEPIGHPLHAHVIVPGSKSITNRALLMAALAEGVSELQGVLFSDDSRYLMSALKTLGFELEIDEASAVVRVAGKGGVVPAASADGTTLFIGNAGTAARFLVPFLALGTGVYRVDGIERMRQRPILDLIEAMQTIGVDVIDELGTGCPPVRILANGLTGGQTSVVGANSSQFLSALLITAPYAQTDVHVEVVGELVSTPYIDITLRMMEQFGVTVDAAPDYRTFQIKAGQRYKGRTYSIEPDASNASYFFAAAAVVGGSVTVPGLDEDSLQGDAQFPKVLAQMGCDVVYGEKQITVTGPVPGSGQKLSGIEVDLNAMPDTAQTLAAVAPFASSPVHIQNVANMRIKETDRLSAVVKELGKLGIRTDEYPDALTIYPAEQVTPASIHTYDDHRMAMAFTLIGLRERGVVIEDPKCVNKTFPNYFDVVKTLY
ncbi:MAG: 3-phosphoshikimate 1-carboxyvinyltransferase [Bacilli bacterium]|nr:3-phosphoshikimate 1-carboxyvinyltransferase [Bacilli bacterium]